MPQYKLFYFNARGRGEVIRMLFKHLEIPFEDVRINKDDWPTYKKQSPSGQAPWIEMDGEKMTQSMAIARMIAQEHGLMGKDSKECYSIERGIAQCEDVADELRKFYFMPAGAEREEKIKEMTSGRGEALLVMMDRLLDEGKGFLALGRLTLADFSLLTLVDSLRGINPDLLAKHPKLTAHHDHICKLSPNVCKWVKERPETSI